MLEHNSERSISDVKENRAFVFSACEQRPECHARIDSKSTVFHIRSQAGLIMWGLKPNSPITAGASHLLTIKQCDCTPPQAPAYSLFDLIISLIISELFISLVILEFRKLNAVTQNK